MLEAYTRGYDFCRLLCGFLSPYQKAITALGVSENTKHDLQARAGRSLVDRSRGRCY